MAGRFFTTEPPGDPIYEITNIYDRHKIKSHKFCLNKANEQKDSEDFYISKPSSWNMFYYFNLFPKENKKENN